MIVKEILAQVDHIFEAVYQCEHCLLEHQDTGIETKDFYKVILPLLQCKHCGKTSRYHHYQGLSTSLNKRSHKIS
jgi:hypothetical protein